MNKIKDPVGFLRDEIKKSFDGYNHKQLTPTGVQEDYIIPFGCGAYSIILCLDNNKAGKTATAVNILKNVFWDHDPEYFDYPVYKEWPFAAKQGRICGTVKNTSDDGPIRTEIMKWWPKSMYSAEKAGKNYHSLYTILDPKGEPNGFGFDVMTYKQDPDEYEGPFLGWTWADEPPPEKLVGAITSRFVGGGIWIVTATPINCGPFLDVIADLRDNGKRIHTTSHNIYESEIETGKPNHKGTKKGLWTKDQIDDYVAGIPIDERPARVFGQANAKSGKIYPAFTRSVHVVGEDHCYFKSLNFDSVLAQTANCFCIIDPHRKYYPALSWWMLTEDNDFICYNEWPTKELLGAYYDELRTNSVCNYTPEDISKFIRICDGTGFGLTIKDRFMDPIFGRAADGEYGRSESLLGEYAKAGIEFRLPPIEKIDVQRGRIRDLLRYEKSLPINQHNKPNLFVMPHCENTIRALERHYWDEEKEKEAERYKDFVDLIRYMLAGLGGSGYIKPTPKRPKRQRMEVDEMAESMISAALA